MLTKKYSPWRLKFYTTILDCKTSFAKRNTYFSTFWADFLCVWIFFHIIHNKEGQNWKRAKNFLKHPRLPGYIWGNILFKLDLKFQILLSNIILGWWIICCQEYKSKYYYCPIWRISYGHNKRITIRNVYSWTV